MLLIGPFFKTKTKIQRFQTMPSDDDYRIFNQVNCLLKKKLQFGNVCTQNATTSIEYSSDVCCISTWLFVNLFDRRLAKKETFYFHSSTQVDTFFFSVKEMWRNRLTIPLDRMLCSVVFYSLRNSIQNKIHWNFCQTIAIVPLF